MTSSFASTSLRSPRRARRRTADPVAAALLAAAPGIVGLAVLWAVALPGQPVIESTTLMGAGGLRMSGSEVAIDGRITEPDLAGTPNTECERVTDGHAEEWRTRRILDEPLTGGREKARVRYGAFAGSRLRLIT